MIAKQDIISPRAATDLERKYNFNKSFAELLGLAQAAQNAAERAKNELENLSAEEIFNILTGGGEEQGIYRLGGKIYLNATYIATGILLADLIRAGVLQSQDGETFYLDLESGVLKGKFTELSISGKSVQDIAKDEATLAEWRAQNYANDAAHNAVLAQTQEDIFNKLTNNGAMQGLFMEDGNMYMNATYIKSGQLLADLIKAGVLKSRDGDAFYLDLDNGILKGKFTEFSIAGKSVAMAEDLNAFRDSVASDIEGIQSQLDGNITSWFYDHVPSTTNEPAVNWTTEEDKNLHLGDLFYIVDNEEHGGLVYRWALVNDTYQWTLVEDSEVAKALADAAEAKDIADGKRRVFVVQPIPPYDVGDLWAQGSSGDLMRCRQARTSAESYLASDWELASKYIDAEQAGNIAQDKVDAQTQTDIFNKLTADGKVKGVFLERGQLYINADYIKSGTLLADLIQAGVLKSNDGETFYLDLEQGILNGNFTSLSVAGKSVADISQDAVDAQTQEDIFKKLTNDGAIQGIYLEDGELYINANYIKSGQLAADLIKAGVLKSPDGEMSISLDGGEANFFKGINTNGLKVRDSKTADVDLFHVEAVDTLRGPSARMTMKNAAGETVLEMHETVSSNAATEASGTMLKLLSPDGVYSVEMWALNEGAHIRMAKNGSGSYVLSIDESGNIDFWPDKIMGLEAAWKSNGDGTYTLIGK